MRHLIVFAFLVLLQTYSRLFYRQQSAWVGEVPEKRWPPYSLVAILNHTSLCEYLFAAQTPMRFLWRMAGHCTLPIASVTMQRPIIGLFWRMVAANPISITRERDDTWQQVLEAIEDPRSMLLILPEGRMKRGNGLDKKGHPMTVRSGIADLIQGLEGRALIAYSQGLHHVQIPGEGFPKHFQPVRMRFEALDIGEYRQRLQEGLELANEKDYLVYKRRVKEDLESRRDRYCTSDVGGTDEPEAWEGAERPPIF